jgi:16S rRNA processing protein RimM
MVAESAGRVLVGVITGAHGVRGEVRIKSFTADPAAVGRYGPVGDETGQRSLDLHVLRVAKDMVIARVSGIADRTAAEALRGLRLFVDRSALPATQPEEFYHADLVGLRVERADGALYGTVISVQNHGAGDILEIKRPDGAVELMAFTRKIFPLVDLPGARLVVAPPEFVTAEAEGAG